MSIVKSVVSEYTWSLWIKALPLSNDKTKLVKLQRKSSALLDILHGFHPELFPNNYE